MCERAANYFANDDLPLGDSTQSIDDYVAQVSATTGLPHVLVRRNMQKIRSMLAEMRSVLNGLTRNLDWEVLDRGFGEVRGHSSLLSSRSFARSCVAKQFAGCALVVDSSCAAQDPLILKPGSAEPWTPFRIIQALVRAGAPSEASFIRLTTRVLRKF